MLKLAVLTPPAASPPVTAAPAAPAPAGPAATQSSLVVPPGQVALTVSARFGKDPPGIPGALHWRVYADKPDPNGGFRVLKEDRNPSPTFVLPPGGYVVDVCFGLANVAKRVQLKGETVKETFEIAAGGARFEGRVGDARIPAGQISFDVFPGSQFEPGDKRPIARDVVQAGRNRLAKRVGCDPLEPDAIECPSHVAGGVRSVADPAERATEDDFGRGSGAG